MKCKYIITRKQNKIFTYYFEDDTLIDIKVEPDVQSILQNIYVAKVKDVVKNINSAFVDITPQIKCYLSLNDCEHPIHCSHVIHQSTDTIVPGDEILVQVIKDAVKTKDPTVSTKLSISGKYLAISYPNTKVGYSGKLTMKEKNIVKQYFSALPKSLYSSSYGYVFRTNVRELLDMEQEDIRPEGKLLLQQEMETLTRTFQNIIESGVNRSLYSLLYESKPAYLNRILNVSSAHELLVVTDEQSIYDELCDAIPEASHEKQQHTQYMESRKLQYYNDTSLSMDRLYRLEHYLTEATAKKVWLKSGGYLIIEPTEACTVIDVNSGKYSGKKSISETSLLINLEAATEVARQLRLRNISGIIIVDFINMKEESQNQKLLQQLESLLKLDPVKTNVIDMTPLGLVEITRKKIEAPLLEQLRTAYETH